MPRRLEASTQLGRGLGRIGEIGLSQSREEGLRFSKGRTSTRTAGDTRESAWGGGLGFQRAMWMWLRMDQRKEKQVRAGW